MSPPAHRPTATRRGFIGGVLAAGSAILLGDHVEARARDTADRTVHPPGRVAGRVSRAAPSHEVRRFSAGTSNEGRSIDVITSVATRERISVLVVATVHGDEIASKPIAESFSRVRLPDDVSLHVVPEMNPDGRVANRRHNARGVDLNRNFPWRWTGADGGPAEMSEPETRAVVDLVTFLRPDVSIWIHQPLGYVGPIGACPPEWADAWRFATGDRRRDGVDQHGGGESWAANVAGVPTLLVEVQSWASTPELIAAHTAGFESLLTMI